MDTKPAFNPVLLDIPEQIETERLLLRAPRPGDGAMISESVLETLEDLRRNPASMLWAMEEQTVAKAEEFARRGAANWILRAELFLLALHRANGEYAGQVGTRRFNWETRVFEIGWRCRKPFQGQCLITEAARALTEFAFTHLGARRVWCACDEENIKSWRVAERLGFEHEGTLKSERCNPDSTRRSMRIYATTR